MSIDDLLAAHRRFVRTDRAEIGARPRHGLAILACMDARLSGGFLERALGLERGDATVIRVAGNRFTDGQALRSLVLTVFLQGVREVLVLGHSDCALAAFDAAGLLEAMKARGVPREALPIDLRGWVGAFGNIEANVRETVRRIREAPMLPRDLRVRGAVMDSDTGEVTPVGEDPPETTAPAAGPGPGAGA